MNFRGCYSTSQTLLRIMSRSGPALSYTQSMRLKCDYAVTTVANNPVHVHLHDFTWTFVTVITSLHSIFFLRRGDWK